MQRGAGPVVLEPWKVFLCIFAGNSRYSLPGTAVGIEFSKSAVQAAQHERGNGCVVVLEAAHWVSWYAIETLYVWKRKGTMGGRLMHRLDGLKQQEWVAMTHQICK